MQKKIIRQYYILSFLFSAGSLSVISAIYVTYLMKNGLNLFEVNLVNSIFYFTLFVCEIPTGAFADIFGRKRSFVAACALLSSSMFIYGSSHTITGFVLAEVIGGIGATFRSGAFKAWLVDSLKFHGYDGVHHHIFGRENLYCQIGGGVGAVTGSYLAAYNMKFPWFLAGTMMAITAITSHLMMREDYFVPSVFSWKNGLQRMRNTAMTSIHYGMNHKAVRFILVMTGVQIFAIQSLNMYWQPYFRNHNVSEQHLGFIFVGIMVAIALGGLITTRLKVEGREKKAIIIVQICIGIFAILSAIVPGIVLILLFFLLHEVPRGCWSPLIDGYLQKRIPSEERATITSFCAIAPHIGGAIGLISSGLIAEYCGISVAWMISGSVLVIGALLVAKNGDTELH